MLSGYQEENKTGVADVVIPLTSDTTPKPEENTTSSTLRTYAKAAAVLATSTAAYLVAKSTGWLPWSWWRTSDDVSVPQQVSTDSAGAEVAVVPSQTALTSSNGLSGDLSGQFSASILSASDSLPTASTKELVHFEERELSGLALPGSGQEFMSHEVNVGRKLLAVGNEFRVNTYTQNSQYYSAVAALSGGGFIVTWASYLQDGSGDGIYGQRYDVAGTASGSEFQINTYTTGSQIFPSVAGLLNGGFVVIWMGYSQDASNSNIYGQRYDAASIALGNEFQVNTYTLSYQAAPFVTSLSTGGFVVTWQSYGQDGSGEGVYGQYYNEIGSPVGAEFQVNTYATGDQQAPCAAGLPNGGFVVTWNSYNRDGSDNGIYAKRYNAVGSALGNEFQVNTNTIAGQWLPSVAALLDSDFVVVWSSGICNAQLYNATWVRIDNEFQISTAYGVEVQYTPRVAALARGGFVVVWTGYSLGTTDIYCRRFDATGTALGLEFIVSTYTADNQLRPSVAPLANGGFVVTWHSTGQDGSANGIYGRIFSATPVLQASSGSLNYTENGLALVLDDSLLVTDSDDELQSATVSITANFASGQDILAFPGGSINGFYNASSGILSFYGSDTVSAYQAVLRGVTYRNTGDNPSTAARNISFVVQSISFPSNTATRVVNVIAVNDAPVATFSGGATPSYTENGVAVVIDGALTVSDVDSTNLQSAVITITNFQTADELLFTNQLGITGSYNSTTGTLTLTGSTTPANYQAALRTITYRTTSENPSTTARIISLVVNDGSLNSTSVTKTVNVVAVNDAPVVTLTGGSSSYTENAAPVAVNSGLTVSDVDSANLQSATVTITNLQAGDELVFTNQLGITGAYNAGTGVLTLSGTATPANYQTALRTVSYRSTSDNPSTTARSISFVVSDGSLSSSTVTRTMNVFAVNDAPVVTLSGNNSSYTENAASVSVDSGLTVSDVDSTNLQSAIVNITNLKTGDELLFTNQLGITGSYNSGTGVLTLSGTTTVANYQTALRSVTYRNTLDNFDLTPRSISITVNDGSLDSAVAIQTMNLIAVNDAPAITAGVTLVANNVDAGSPVGAVGTTVDAMIASLGTSYSDVDLNAAKGIAITAADVTHGTWYYSITGGTSWISLGSPSALSSRLLSADGAGQSRIYFQPSPNYNGATSVTFRAWDQTSGVNGGTADTTSNGGTTAFSTNTEIASLTITAAPVVVLSGSNSSYTEKAAAVLVDSGLTVSDVDNASLQGAAMQIINLQTGDELLFSNQLGITGSYNATTGILTLSGSATVANYQTALRSVTYRNTLSNPDTTARQIHVTANDGSLNSAAVTKTVNVIAVDDAPILTLSGASASYTENAAPVLVDSGLTVSDVDSANLQSAVIKITNLQTGDELLFSNQLGITGSYNSTTGILTLTGNASVASYQTALRSVTYRTTSDNPNTTPRIINWVINDGSLNSTEVTGTVNVIAVNDAPVITLTAGGSSYTENASPVLVDGNLTVSDVDSTNLQSALITIGNFQAGDELLFTNQLGITGNYNSSTGVLTLTGTATLGDYQTALRSVRYRNTLDNPDITPRQISMTVNDGSLNSTTVTKTMNVIAVDDAPVIYTKW
jgi:hypothetical protein